MRRCPIQGAGVVTGVEGHVITLLSFGVVTQQVPVAPRASSITSATPVSVRPDWR